MGTFDDFFLAFGDAFAGMNTFVVKSDTDNTPVFDFGLGGLGKMAGVHGVTEVPQQPPNLVAGVYGAGLIQPGVIGFSRDGDGAQGASFTGTAVRAASFFGPGVHSISGALSGITGISDTQGPPVGMNIPTTAGVVGTSGSRPGVIGTSNALMGIYGFSAGNAGVVGETANPNSFAGFFAGNAVVTGTLTAGVKNAMVAFPDGSQRVLHCMESPEHWFEGNITGVSAMVTELGAKRLGLLLELRPQTKSVGVLVNINNPVATETTTQDVKAAASAIGLDIEVINASNPREIDEALADRKSTRLNSSHMPKSRMPSSA